MELKKGMLALVMKNNQWWLKQEDLEGKIVREFGPYKTRFEAILIGANISLDEHLVFDGGVVHGNEV
jgi:hypothetical protein